MRNMCIKTKIYWQKCIFRSTNVRANCWSVQVLFHHFRMVLQYSYLIRSRYEEANSTYSNPHLIGFPIIIKPINVTLFDKRNIPVKFSKWSRIQLSLGQSSDVNENEKGLIDDLSILNSGDMYILNHIFRRWNLFHNIFLNMQILIKKKNIFIFQNLEILH